jgi:hypothetical protein
MEVKTNFGIGGTKSVFDAGVKALVVKAIYEGKVKQTKEGAVEVFSIINNGKEIAQVRENYKNGGRSTIVFNGKIFTRKDSRNGLGEINKRLSDAASSENLNTVEEKDFEEIYSLAASRSI